jgi:glycosyltransferase involved in cell wall biosynthesis
MRRVLFLTPQMPYPPHQGTSLRNWHILRGVALHADVSLLSFADDGVTAIPEPVAACCRRVDVIPAPARTTGQRLRQLVTMDEPDLALRLANSAFADALRRRLAGERVDVVQIEGLEMARYLPVVREMQPSAHVVLDCHNAETELQRRTFATDVGQPRRWLAAAYSRLQAGRLAAYERWACRAADAVVAVSEADRDHLRTLAGDDLDIAVIPNCIDTQAYAGEPVPDDPALRHDLVFTGKMDYRPNVDAVLWFAETVWPRLVEGHPGLSWAIVGQKPHPRLASIGRLPGVRLTGRVERIQPYLAGAIVYVSPLRIGSGTRLKLLEAMATGLPIVSTSVGAEGLKATVGRDLLIADNADEQLAAVSRLLETPDERRRLSENARAAAAAYDWRRVIPRFAALYEKLSGGKAR